MILSSVDELQRYIGIMVGKSNWLTIDQKMIDEFAAATDDHQAIHVDPVAAAKSPFGGTIAHGFLTLSLLTKLAQGNMHTFKTTVMAINAGFNKIRFLAPVPSGSRIRAGFVLQKFERKSATSVQTIHEVTVEIEGSERPALVAEWIAIQHLQNQE